MAPRRLAYLALVVTTALGLWLTATSARAQTTVCDHYRTQTVCQGQGRPATRATPYLGMSPEMGHALGYELFGRKRDEEVLRRWEEQTGQRCLVWNGTLHCVPTR
jgi:hypothetical protein